MSELFDFGKNILGKQPFSVLLGTELKAFEPGKAELSLAVRDERVVKSGWSLSLRVRSPE